MSSPGFIARLTNHVIAPVPPAPPRAQPLTGPCPTCGADCEWSWTRVAGDGTAYTIECPACGSGE